MRTPDVRPLKGGLRIQAALFPRPLNTKGMLNITTVCGLNRHSTALANLAYLGKLMPGNTGPHGISKRTTDQAGNRRNFTDRKKCVM